MIIQDLTLCNDLNRCTDKKLLAIGWLNREDDYPKGGKNISIQFIKKLQDIFQQNKFKGGKIRGFSACKVCVKIYPNFEGCQYLGSCKLWIPQNDIIYVMPDFIIHHVSEHDYLPPKEFIKAVLDLNLDINFNADHYESFIRKELLTINIKNLSNEIK